MIRSVRTITAASYLAMLFLGVGNSLVGSAARDIGLSATQIGIMLAIQSVGLTITVVLAGALSDTHSKARILFLGSLLLGGSFMAFYLFPGFWPNLVVMALIGAGGGAYEGVTDAMLFDLHEARAGFHININHLFVTLGSATIALYLLFLQVRWRAAVVQSGLVVLALAVIFALVILPAARRGQARLGLKLRAIARSRLIAVLFLCAILSVGVELTTMGILSTFLAELRGYATLTAKLGLVVFLAGVAGGRLLIGTLVPPHRVFRSILILFALSSATFALLFLVDLGPLTLPAAFLAGVTLSSQLPLILTYAGSSFREMTGTVLGAVKVGIPIGGILVPLLISAMTSTASFGIALAILPAGMLVGLLLLMLAGREASPAARALA